MYIIKGKFKIVKNKRCKDSYNWLKTLSLYNFDKRFLKNDIKPKKNKSY